MPPQDNASAAKSSDYGNQEIIKILASPDFQSAPAELQRQVRERLGITSTASAPATKPDSSDASRGIVGDSPKKAFDWLFGIGPQYQHKTLLEDLERSMRNTAATRQHEDENDPTRTRTGAAVRQYSPLVMADVAKYTRGALGGKSATLGAASMIPQARPFIGAYGAITSGKELFTPQPGENDADRLERILSSLSGIAGSAALAKSGRLRSAKSEMESRIAKATYASGSQPGVPNAYRMTIPDIMETVTQQKMPLKTVSDIAKAVEATNERFNTHMALAEQPYANEQVLPRKAADALRSAAADLPKSAANEAAQMRNAATRFDRPMSLRELGREMRQQNKLWGTHGGKTSLELSTAKTRASVAINDILRKTLRDTYVDFLESKHPGSGLRDMRMRQEQILNLRDTLGEYNRSTGKMEKGQAEKLEAAQAKFKGGPGSEDVHGVASQHGVRAYLRLPKIMRRGPETQANRAVGKAFKEDIGHRIPRRKLGPLSGTGATPTSTAPTPTPTTPPPGGKYNTPTKSRIFGPRKPSTPPVEDRGIKKPEKRQWMRHTDNDVSTYFKHRFDLLRDELKHAESSGDASTLKDVKRRIKELDEMQHKPESFKRQLGIAGKRHPEWADRVQKQLEAHNRMIERLARREEEA